MSARIKVMASTKNYKKRAQTYWVHLKRSVWFFPVIVTFFLLSLTALKISGTSIGIYNNFFYGENQKDSNLLYGAPQPIRSDEWLVNTQLTIAQSRDGFNRTNENITNGRDMSLNIDVPYKEWSIAFKPQNLAFLVVPLEFAFAFKWWLLLYLLILSVYFFALRLFPGKRLMASIIGLGFAFSPFVFWWYQSFTLASLFYGFFIMIMGMRILNGEPVKFARRVFSTNVSSLIYSVLLAYLLVCFALVFYPPFQAPVAITVAAFLTGYALHLRFAEKRLTKLRQLVRPVIVFGLACILTGAIGAAFALTRQNALHSITHTVYPGARVVASAGFPVDRMLATFLQPQLQRGGRGSHYYTNQSESSSFILLLPYLFIPGVVLTIYTYRKYRRVDWVFITIQGCVLLFWANMFVPGGQQLYHLLLLDKVPHERLVLGLGFVGIIHMLYLMKGLLAIKVNRHKLTISAAVYTIACLIAMLLVGKYTREHFPVFITSWLLIAGAAVFFCGMIYMTLIRRFMIASCMLLLFSLLSIWHIHPLYRGLGVAANNRVIPAMQAVSKPGDTWVSLDQIYIENFGLMADRDSLTGVQFYPDLDFWRQVEGKKADDIYNRYAHVLFTANPDYPPLQMAQLDAFIARFDCGSFNQKNVDFAISLQPISNACTQEVSTVSYPAQTFYLYRLVRNP